MVSGLRSIRTSFLISSAVSKGKLSASLLASLLMNCPSFPVLAPLLPAPRLFRPPSPDGVPPPGAPSASAAFEADDVAEEVLLSTLVSSGRALSRAYEDRRVFAGWCCSWCWCCGGRRVLPRPPGQVAVHDGITLTCCRALEGPLAGREGLAAKCLAWLPWMKAPACLPHVAAAQRQT